MCMNFQEDSGEYLLNTHIQKQKLKSSQNLSSLSSNASYMTLHSLAEGKQKINGVVHDEDRSFFLSHLS